MDLAEVQGQLEIEFQDPDLLREALTHASCLNEPSIGYKRHNEALAWLGDALIHWVVSEREYDGELSAEELTDQRKKYVNKTFLAGLAVKFRLGEALILPEGQEKIGGRTNERNLHTLIEAVVGAVYRDQGFEVAERFVLDTLFVD
jgi:ribonuclease-3